eukprot:2429865-Prymnesium_polylepis.1
MEAGSHQEYRFNLLEPQTKNPHITVYHRQMQRSNKADHSSYSTVPPYCDRLTVLRPTTRPYLVRSSLSRPSRWVHRVLYVTTGTTDARRVADVVMCKQPAACRASRTATVQMLHLRLRSHRTRRMRRTA